jgi:hypothetical protein
MACPGSAIAEAVTATQPPPIPPPPQSDAVTVPELWFLELLGSCQLAEAETLAE